MKIQDLINEVDALEPGQRLGMLLHIAGSFSEPELEAIQWLVSQCLPHDRERKEGNDV